MSEQEQPKQKKAMQLPNGIVIRPSKIVRIIPHGPDFRGGESCSQASEGFYVKMVEVRSEYNVRFKTKEARDEFVTGMLEELQK